MEGLEKKNLLGEIFRRTYILAGILALFGAWLFLAPRPDTQAGAPNEAKLIEWTPVTVMGASYERSGEDPRVSGKMDETTYRWLKPFGIVVRQYKIGADTFDAVVIASRSRSSFHDPRVCFSAQNWTIEQNSLSSVETKTRGPVPITMLQIVTSGVKGQIAAYLYKGPGNRFYSGPQGLKWGMLMEQLKGSSNVDGVFYRFIPSFRVEAHTPEEREQQVAKLKKFIGAFLDAANESSHGYF